MRFSMYLLGNSRLLNARCRSQPRLQHRSVICLIGLLPVWYWKVQSPLFRLLLSLDMYLPPGLYYLLSAFFVVLR